MYPNSINMTYLTRCFLIWSFLLIGTFSFSQPREQYIKVIVAPDHANWTYKSGENVNFHISVLKSGIPLNNISIKYEIKPEKMKTIKSGDIKLTDKFVTIDGGTMNNPGFLRCFATVEFEGKDYSGYGTAGFDPYLIKPTTREPKDFTKFWIDAKNELASLSLDAKMVLIEERCTEKVDVYEVNIQNYPQNSRIYGILCIPKARGRYPAVLKVPGAGIRPYYGDIKTSEKGAITLEIGIHGIPVTMNPGVYNDLRYGALKSYNTYDLDDRDDYYYKRVYLGCVRAIDFIFSLDQFDGENLAVTGGSQGGALSIVTAGLDERVRWIVPYYPALADLTGYVFGRAGGWPHMFNNVDDSDPVIKKEIENSAYYDVVNFARYVQAEGFYSWGYNDNVCPPTSMFSAYNVIDAPKQLFVVPETGHWAYPEQYDKTNAWLYEKLGIE